MLRFAAIVLFFLLTILELECERNAIQTNENGPIAGVLLILLTVGIGIITITNIH